MASLSSYIWTTAALTFCVLFGLAIIANVQLVGDGSWFWYADLARHGHHIYSDLKLPLQPFFVLETEAVQSLFGDGWLASKIPAVLNVLTLAISMCALILMSKLSDRQRATLLLAAFFIGIRFEAYRFDDYHVASDCFVLLSAVCLLRLRWLRGTSQLAVVAILGVLSGLTTMTRINDGALLFLFCCIAVAIIARTSKVASVVTYAAFVAATSAATVSLTGDSLITWATYSVLHVGAIKGGTAEFLSDPIHVFTSAWVWVTSIGRGTLLETFAIALSWTFLIASFSKRTWRTSLIKAVLGTSIIAGTLFFLWSDVTSGSVVVSVHALLTLSAYFLPLVMIIRAAIHFIRPEKLRRWSPIEVLLLLPVLMMASGSLSSAGFFNDVCMDSAMLLVIMPIISTNPRGRTRSTLLSVALLAAFSGAWYRYNDPASWISYATYPLFQNRVIVQHPNFGPMVIDKRTLGFISNICPLLHDGRRTPELLSIPWPYANYYCHITPWHNYIQTWFDTTTQAQIHDLLSELETQPPEWILYQRQLDTLQLHEVLYNSGQRIAQRDLDDYISTQIATGQWRIAYREQYGLDSDWLLMRTRWNVSQGSNLLRNSNGGRGLAAWQVTVGNPLWSSRDGRLVVTKRRDDSLSNSSKSMLTQPLAFQKGGPVVVKFNVDSQNLNSSPGSGYTVDLIDTTANAVRASLGWSNANTPTRRYALGAVIDVSHNYLLRLRFDSPEGVVSFSNLSAEDSYGRVTSRLNVKNWNADPVSPTWASTPHDGGCFAVSSNGASSAQSTLLQSVTFLTGGPVTLQMRIGADHLNAMDGFGYVSDLYDVTKNTIVASLDVPAIESAPRFHSFTGIVNSSDSYQVRLQYEAGAGNVSFCRLKLEYGTIATPWADNVRRPLAASRTRAAEKAKPHRGRGLNAPVP